MLIRKKMLLALVLGIGLVGAGIGTLAIRSTHSDNTAATNMSEATPAQLTNQDQKTPDQLASEKTAEANSPNVASNGTRRRYSNGRVYYDYGNQPRGRTFWQTHRDKLTVAGGSGSAALVGGPSGSMYSVAVSHLTAVG